MATHPKKAVPGALHGRPLLLRPEDAPLIRRCAAAGYTLDDIAAHIGVHRSTLIKRRSKSPEFRHAIKEGRAEYARRQAAPDPARGAEWRRTASARQAAETAQARRAAELVRDLLLLDHPTRREDDAPTLSPAQPGTVSAQPIPLADPLDEYAGEGAPLPIDDPW